MCKYAPFLQMYTVYVEKFESAMKTIDVYRTKSPRFAALLQDLQVSITAADAAVFVYNSLFTKDEITKGKIEEVEVMFVLICRNCPKAGS